MKNENVVKLPKYDEVAVKCDGQGRFLVSFKNKGKYVDHVNCDHNNLINIMDSMWSCDIIKEQNDIEKQPDNSEQTILEKFVEHSVGSQLDQQLLCEIFSTKDSVATIMKEIINEFTQKAIWKNCDPTERKNAVMEELHKRLDEEKISTQFVSKLKYVDYKEQIEGMTGGL